MELDDLGLLQFAPGRGGVPAPGVHLETCQRYLWIGARRDLGQREFVAGASFAGAAAYLFLLRILCGLESRIRGETEIVGQFRSAWEHARAAGTVSDGLATWIKSAFHDAQAIRHRHLQVIGGSSYGSLLRKLIRREPSPRDSSPILLVGAGQLARSVAPYLIDRELWLCNRSFEHLQQLRRELVETRKARRVAAVNLDIPEATAWAQAGVVIICAPPDARRDERWLALWQRGGPGPVAKRRVYHLGATREESGPWRPVLEAVCLDEFYAIHAAIADHRNQALLAAERACDEKAYELLAREALLASAR